MKCCAFQTIRPVVLRKKRSFSAHFGPGGAVPPPRVSPFSKVKRSKTAGGSPGPAGFPPSVPGREGNCPPLSFPPSSASGFFEAGWELCYTTPPCRRGTPFGLPSRSALRFSHEKTREDSCQRFRQWIQKKGRECSNTPRPAGQSPDGIIASARHDQVFAPARVRTSCRGRLLSTFHHVDKQSHDDAGHNLRGHVQQELHHRQSPPCGGTAPGLFLPCAHVACHDVQSLSPSSSGAISV